MKIMTEQEIVKYLKNNMSNGVAFAFMPDEVQAWAITNPQEILVYSRRIGQEKGTWERKGGSNYPLHYDSIYALPDSFQIKKESSGEWVEFEIDQRGNFHCFKDDDMHYFFWANWDIFLKAFSDEYTAFGGWHYQNNKGWFTTPQIEIENGYLANNYSLDVKPAIPSKIRFWRKGK